MNADKQIKIDYGVIIPTDPVTIVVKPESQDRLLVFVGTELGPALESGDYGPDNTEST